MHTKIPLYSNVIEYQMIVKSFFSEPLFKDILSDVMLEESVNLLSYDGYRAFHLPYSLPSFMNFIVLEFENEPSEVWLGWVISEFHGLEQPSFRSQDARLVHMFTSWFYDLLRACSPIPKQETLIDC